MNWRYVACRLALVLCISEPRARKSASALVSPAVQHSFGTPERFLDAVRMVVQQVQITDRAGGLWAAYFSMQRQSDGSWRMNGCHLVQPARTISA